MMRFIETVDRQLIKIDAEANVKKRAVAEEVSISQKRAFVGQWCEMERDFAEAKARRKARAKALRTYINSKASETGITSKEVARIASIQLFEEELRKQRDDLMQAA